MERKVAAINPSNISSIGSINEVTLTVDPLSLEEFVAVARYGAELSFSEGYMERVKASRALVEKFLAEDRLIYGLTTGFGDNVRTRIPPENAVQLQYNILRSHAVSVGDPLPEEGVRAVWLMQLLSLGQGVSGVRLETLSLIRDCLNAGVTAFAPRDGSVQALAIEAYMNLVLVGEGQAYYRGELLPGREALDRAGLTPTEISYKEGLCLTNGANSVTALSALALWDIVIAAQTADIAAALSYEALRGNILACDERLNSLKAHDEQKSAAGNVRKLLADSRIADSNRGRSVQDPLVLRSVPQVHGAVKYYIKCASRSILEEMNSCTDNPVIWPIGDDGVALMGANFDGTYPCGASDILCIAAANLAKLLERRIDKMTNRNFSGYPAFLATNPGVDNCYMIPQYTAAGLVNEIRGLALPSTADSVPTSANWEDPVSMGMWGSQKSWRVGRKLQYMVAIELMTACRAFDLMSEGLDSHSSATREVYELIRGEVPKIDGDRHFGPDIEKIRELVENCDILRAAESRVGTLAL